MLTFWNVHGAQINMSYTFTDDCQLKKIKISTSSATFTFIYLISEISLIWDVTFEAIGTIPSLAFTEYIPTLI